MALGYKEGYLRKSVVNDPLERKNTNDNTPAIIHYNIVEGDKVKIVASPKGFGSENMGKDCYASSFCWNRWNKKVCL